MFGTSTYGNIFRCMTYTNEMLSTREISVDIQLDMSGCDLHIETVAFDRLSYLFDVALTDCILINRNNPELEKIDELSYNKLVYCFGEPLDTFVAMMLYQKLVAILGEHIYVEGISLQAEPGGGFRYSFNHEQLGTTILPEDDDLAQRNLVPYGIDKIWYYRDDLTCNDRLTEYSSEGIAALPVADWDNSSGACAIVPDLLPDAFVLPEDGDLTWEGVGMSWAEPEVTTEHDEQIDNIKQFRPTVVK